MIAHTRVPSASITCRQLIVRQPVWFLACLKSLSSLHHRVKKNGLSDHQSSPKHCLSTNFLSVRRDTRNSRFRIHTVSPPPSLNTELMNSEYLGSARPASSCGQSQTSLSLEPVVLCRQTRRDVI
ncbi:hypothetical protein RRG08_065622 [Elysia crispata]|uniref:Uncharacterized protein n=1 Tax=Elysia crispata TaxID=231223 RepID=A0AAE1D254_9GAST|nr:hypothetical protein RRG08_065622 [Elysia crispata]